MIRCRENPGSRVFDIMVHSPISRVAHEEIAGKLEARLALQGT